MMNEAIIIRGKTEAKEWKDAPVKPTIIIGVGGSGGDVLLRVRKRFFERYGSLSQFPIVSYLWLDTDATEKEVGAGVFTEQIAFSNNEKIMTVVPDTTTITGDLNNHPHVKSWFYPGLSKLKTMTEGAGQIRAYSRLGFFAHYPKIRNSIINAAQAVRNVENIKTVRDRHHLEANPADLQVFFVFSVAGGTGSGMFLDLAFLVKDIFAGQQLTSVGVIMMPGLFNPNEDRVFANGYAALKELEHYSYDNDFEVTWPDMVKRKLPGPPFNYTYLVDRVNHAKNAVEFSNRELVFNMVAESVFKDFTQSDFAGYKRGVRVNLDQYMVDSYSFVHRNENGESIIDQSFRMRYGSFGMASITVPADRIEQACAYRLAADVVDHWGSLSNSEYNAASLTEEVLRRVLPRINLYEGAFNAEGIVQQRRDIQNFLRDDGHRQGQTIDNLVDQSIAQAAREARENFHKQKGQTMAQYLRASMERELAKLRHDQGDPQKWGDYARAVHFNKEELARASQEGLRREMGEIINEQHQSVGYAVALLRQLTVVLRDENREYIASFERGRNLARKRSDETKRQLDQLFAEIGQHENRINWDGRKGTILAHDIERFEQLAPEFLKSLLLEQVRGAAIDVCESVIRFIGMHEKTDEGETIKAGMIGELYDLGGHLSDLKKRLMNRYEHFRQPSDNELSLQLYDPSDIDKRYLPRYLGTGEDARRNVESVGDQILQKLQTSVMDLPELLRRRGRETVENEIRDLAREPFRNLKQDFDVIETLWKKFPEEQERIKQVRFIYEKAKFWLSGGSRPRSYQLHAERHKIIVGVPQQTQDPSKLEEFKRELSGKIRSSGDPAVSIQNIADKSEIVFYNEVGGIPINWADTVADLRHKYLQKHGEGEELHTDANEIKFEDLVVLTEQEREELERAHECFLLGVIFGEIRPERDSSGRVRYLWSETIGILKRPQSLGIEQRALSELISKPVTREKILKQARDKKVDVYRDRDLLARFNALLTWYAQEVYPDKHVKGSDGVEHIEQSNMGRAIYKLIMEVVRTVESQELSNPQLSAREFFTKSEDYRNNLDRASKRLEDGRRMLDMTPSSADGEQQAGSNGQQGSVAQV
ncbi:MAG TPA: tubulin-like doman-containing protein [Pyrinomonadaceae bacterium]|nr:tubulin-like doman-containing protein [Pyrinomonadaceae bacterium]